LWQQATIEISRRDNSVISYSHHLYMGVPPRAHYVRGELRIPRNATGEVETLCYLVQKYRENETQPSQW